MLQPSYRGEVKYWIQGERRDALHSFWGYLASDLPLDRQVAELSASLARSVFNGVQRYGYALPARPPRDACEYVANARFETVEPSLPDNSYRILNFPAVSPASISVNRMGSTYRVGCDGWRLWRERDWAGPPERAALGEVDPATGRLTIEEVTYVRAGVVTDRAFR